MRPRSPRRHRRSGRPARSLAVVVLGLVAGQLIVLLVVTSAPASAITCPADQWAAAFHAGTELAGDPVGERCDAAIDADWSVAGPGVAGLGTTGYSVRWTRDFALAAGSYTATVTGDDGVRVLIDGESVADGWGDHGPATYTGERTLTAGNHTVVVEYYQNAGGAMVEFSLTGGAEDPPDPGPDCEPGQWAGTYFPNRTLSGPGVGRCSAAVDHDWGDDGPGVPGIGADNFSARWTRSETFAAGPVTLTATADDGIRVFLDDAPVIDAWRDQGPSTFTETRTVAAGPHTIRVEYYERAGGAEVSVEVAGPSQAPDCAPGTWLAAYYANPSVAGQPVARRCEDAVDHAWADGSPDVPGLGADGFSARWTRTVSFGAGNLDLTATADDGIRVYLDDQPVIDQWQDQGATTFTATVAVTAGEHTLRVDYYERGGGATARVAYTGPPPPRCNALQWSATYFGDVALAGPPTPARCEAPLRHEWGVGGPDLPGIPTDGFAARWTRVDTFAAGPITITATADDGVRVYVDDVLVLDEWRDQGPNTYTATPTVSAGEHTIRVEYYERIGGALVDVSYTGGGDPGPVPPPPPGGCTADCDGSWQTLPYELPVSSIHASVLRTGNVLLVAGSGNNLAAFDAGTFTSTVWNPTTGTFVDVPIGADLFCSGHAQLPDGRILLAGGTAAYSTATVNYKGMAKSYIFDPIANTYTETNDMPGGGHWYPSLTSLGNGDILAVGGLDQNAAGSVATEMFDAARGRWLPLAEVPQTFFFWGLYPELKLLTDGRVFYGGVHTFGDSPTAAGSNLYDVATATVTDIPGLRDVNLRDQGASVLLPPAQAGRVLTLGGGNGDAGADAIATTDLIDLRETDPRWRPGPDLPAAKMYVSAVILPDGTVLETGGGEHLRSDPVHESSIYDPVANTFTAVPPDPQDRTYHSQAFLLPDGSVATLGNNPLDGSFDRGISIYRPWYMSRARPAITAAAASFGYGSQQPLTVDGDIGRVTLIRPGSVTHQADPNQRSVDLSVTGTGPAISVTVPNNPNLLPPGYYMMFAQNTDGVPSAATWVRVG